MNPDHVFMLIVAMILFFVLLMGMVAFFVIKHSYKLNRLHFEKHQLINESRRKNIEEGERMMRQLSRDVHDHIGHAATFAIISLNKAKELADTDRMQELLTEVGCLVDEISRESTNISHSINQNYIQAKNLHSLLGEDLEYLRCHRNFSYDMNIVGEVVKLLPEVKLLIYRISQQAFTNILKHSNATVIDLLLEYSGQSFKMVIRDNGIGILPEKLHSRTGIGITNMMERAELMNGKIIIDSSPGNGCSITLFISNVPVI